MSHLLMNIARLWREPRSFVTSFLRMTPGLPNAVILPVPPVPSEAEGSEVEGSPKGEESLSVKTLNFLYV